MLIICLFSLFQVSSIYIISNGPGVKRIAVKYFGELLNTLVCVPKVIYKMVIFSKIFNETESNLKNVQE